jgi:2-hydroxychromene-2-carboxylate isomerase
MVAQRRGEHVLEIWFDFASGYSYPAILRIESVAAGDPALVWRPFLLGPIFAAEGFQDSPFNLFPARGRYMWRDLERICATEGLPLRRPSVFPRKSVLAARIGLLAAEEGWAPAFAKAVFTANFGEDRPIDAPEELVRILDRLGRDGAGTLARAESPERKGLLRAQTEEAMRRGIFGAPTFFASSEMFWGNDRLEQAVAWARAHPDLEEPTSW